MAFAITGIYTTRILNVYLCNIHITDAISTLSNRFTYSRYTMTVYTYILFLSWPIGNHPKCFPYRERTHSLLTTSSKRHSAHQECTTTKKYVNSSMMAIVCNNSRVYFGTPLYLYTTIQFIFTYDSNPLYPLEMD